MSNMENLKACANEKRLQIIRAVAQQPMNVGELQTITGLSQSALSQHLAILRKNYLLGTKKDKQKIYYYIAKDAGPFIAKILAAMCF